MEGNIMVGELKIAVVTGAAGGIGAACAESFRDAGYAVRGWDMSEGLVDRVLWQRVDVADFDSVSEAAADLDRVDVLVNCAGLSEVCPADEFDPARFALTMAVNVNGSFFTTRAMVSQLANAKGTVINIGSIGGHRAGPRRVAYGASKAAVLAMTQILATDLGRFGVRVLAVSPGYVHTGMLKVALRDGVLDESALLSRIPTGRLIEPDELANVILRLTAPEFAAINGSAVVVDGGWLANGAY
jgi:NAD(P)-dependent dehydrogenase (short-subunit alcohol dehydrogenase family)